MTPGARRRTVRSAVVWTGLAVSALFAYLAVRDVRFADVWDALRASNYWWLVPALAAPARAPAVPGRRAARADRREPRAGARRDQARPDDARRLPLDGRRLARARALVVARHARVPAASVLHRGVARGDRHEPRHDP